MAGGEADSLLHAGAGIEDCQAITGWAQHPS